MLTPIFAIPDHAFSVGNQVIGECGERCIVLNEAISHGTVSVLDDSNIAVTRFAEVLALFRLGDGETECIVHAELNPALLLCSDDRAARTAAVSILGNDRVIGSIRLLLRCVDAHIISQEQAYNAYILMRERGAFLPILTREQFNFA